jgi:hypothetical protein
MAVLSMCMYIRNCAANRAPPRLSKTTTTIATATQPSHPPPPTNNPQQQVTWLSGLVNPQSFLTAVCQVTAQKNGWELDKLVIQTDVTKKMGAEVLSLSLCLSLCVWGGGTRVTIACMYMYVCVDGRGFCSFFGGGDGDGFGFYFDIEITHAARAVPFLYHTAPIDTQTLPTPPPPPPKIEQTHHQTKPKQEIDLPARDGAYITGLSLQGARWDTQSGE